MLLTTDITSGIYILEVYSNKSFRIKHPKFEKISLQRGYYYYIGSAQKNFSKRILRHLSSEKKLRWHIDYLLNVESCKIKNVFGLEGIKDLECELVDRLSSSLDNLESIKGFGNSDCNRCESHLIYSSQKIDYSHLCSLYQSTVCLKPSSKEIS